MNPRSKGLRVCYVTWPKGILSSILDLVIARLRVSLGRPLKNPNIMNQSVQRPLTLTKQPSLVS